MPNTIEKIRNKLFNDDDDVQKEAVDLAKSSTVAINDVKTVFAEALMKHDELAVRSKRLKLNQRVRDRASGARKAMRALRSVSDIEKLVETLLDAVRGLAAIPRVKDQAERLGLGLDEDNLAVAAAELVCRGNGVAFLRAAFRPFGIPSFRNLYLGFRPLSMADEVYLLDSQRQKSSTLT